MADPVALGALADDTAYMSTRRLSVAERRTSGAWSRSPSRTRASSRQSGHSGHSNSRRPSAVSENPDRAKRNWAVVRSAVKTGKIVKFDGIEPVDAGQDGLDQPPVEQQQHHHHHVQFPLETSSTSDAFSNNALHMDSDMARHQSFESRARTDSWASLVNGSPGQPATGEVIAPPPMLSLDAFLAAGSPPPPPGYIQRVVLQSSDGWMTSMPFVETVPADAAGPPTTADSDDYIDDFMGKRVRRTSSHFSDDDDISLDIYGDEKEKPSSSSSSPGCLSCFGFSAKGKPAKPDKPLPPWRQKIRTLMNDPYSSTLARIIDVYITCLILLSCLSMLIVTVPEIHDNPNLGVFFFGWELFVSVSFLIEILLRWIGMKNWKEFLTIVNFIDILATFPFFIEIIVNAALGNNIIQSSTSLAGLEVLRVLRLMRLFRLFRLARKSAKVRLLGQAIKESWDGIAAFFAIFVIFAVFCSTLVYYAEQSQAVYINGQWVYTGGDKVGQVSVFTSIPSTMWYITLTLTQGAPDSGLPGTIAGKILSSILVVCSMFMLAFPLTMVTISYASVVRREQAQRMTRKLRKQHAKTARQKAKEAELQQRKLEANNSTRKRSLENTLSILRRKSSVKKSTVMAAAAAASAAVPLPVEEMTTTNGGPEMTQIKATPATDPVRSDSFVVQISDAPMTLEPSDDQHQVDRPRQEPANVAEQQMPPGAPTMDRVEVVPLTTVESYGTIAGSEVSSIPPSTDVVIPIPMPLPPRRSTVSPPPVVQPPIQPTPPASTIESPALIRSVFSKWKSATQSQSQSHTHNQPTSSRHQDLEPLQSRRLASLVMDPTVISRLRNMQSLPDEERIQAKSPELGHNKDEFASLPQEPISTLLRRSLKQSTSSSDKPPGTVHLKVFEFERERREAAVEDSDDEDEVNADLLNLRIAVRNREQFSRLMRMLADAQVLG